VTNNMNIAGYEVNLPQASDINGIKVQSHFTFTGNMQVGIYGDTGSNHPSQLIYVSSLQAANGTVYTFNISPVLSLPAGNYWPTVWTDGDSIETDTGTSTSIFGLYTNFAGATDVSGCSCVTPATYQLAVQMVLCHP